MLDLDLGADSGFEVLRLRKEHPELRECKIVVWTGMGQREQELCKLFGVEKVVSKHQGQEGLRKVLSEILQPLTQSAESNP